MRIDHVGIAVRSVRESLIFYRDSLGLAVSREEEVPSQKVRVAFLKHPQGDGAGLELLEPLGPDGAVAKFLAARGEGLHHLAFRSGDVAADMRRLKEAGRPPLDDAPRPGARGHRVCFVHPKHCHGVLVELVG